MVEYVWYDQINNELFITYLVEDLVLFGYPVCPNCICLGEL